LTDEGLVYGTGYNLVKWKLFYFLGWKLGHQFNVKSK
jgi:hypothetical protein